MAIALHAHVHGRERRGAQFRRTQRFALVIAHALEEVVPKRVGRLLLDLEVAFLVAIALERVDRLAQRRARLGRAARDVLRQHLETLNEVAVDLGTELHGGEAAADQGPAAALGCRRRRAGPRRWSLPQRERGRINGIRPSRRRERHDLAGRGALGPPDRHPAPRRGARLLGAGRPDRLRAGEGEEPAVRAQIAHFGDEAARRFPDVRVERTGVARDREILEARRRLGVERDLRDVVDAQHRAQLIGFGARPDLRDAVGGEIPIRVETMGIAGEQHEAIAAVRGRQHGVGPEEIGRR